MTALLAALALVAASASCVLVGGWWESVRSGGTQDEHGRRVDAERRARALQIRVGEQARQLTAAQALVRDAQRVAS